MSKTIFDNVPGTLGTLVNEDYKTYSVNLDLEVKELWGKDGVAEDAISRISLARGSLVPDGGPYALRYKYRDTQHEQSGLRVSQGQLLAG